MGYGGRLRVGGGGEGWGVGEGRGCVGRLWDRDGGRLCVVYVREVFGMGVGVWGLGNWVG